MTTVDDLIGTPFHESNCLKTALTVLRIKGIEAWMPTEHNRETWAMVRDQMDHRPVTKIGWQPVSDATQPGDLIVMREDDGSETHLGVLDVPGWVVHSTINTGVVRMRLEDLRPRIACVYRHCLRMGPPCQ
jgi:hypothetical protein